MPGIARFVLRSILITLLVSRAFAQTPAGKIRVEVPIFAGGEGMEFFTQSAAEYNELHEKIFVDLYGDPRIADKARIRVLEGSFFEISNAQLDWWKLIRAGEVQSLNEALDGPNWEGDSTWRESFTPGVLDPYIENGQVYGVPLCNFICGLWYNKKMFREQGWSIPKTWDEFFVLCETMKKAGVAPMAFQGRYPYYAQPIIDSSYYTLAGRDRYLAQLRNEAGSFDNPEAIQALSIWQNVVKKAFQDGATGMNHTDSQLQFFLGRTAMISCGAWLKSEMLGKIPEGFELGFFQYPLATAQPKGDPNDYYTSSNYYFVMRRSPHPKEAIDFLRFMTSRAQAGKFSKMQDIPTAIRGGSEGKMSKDLDDAVAVIAKAKNSFGRPPQEQYPEMTDAWSDQIAALMLKNDATPEASAKNLEGTALALRNRLANPDRITVRHRAAPALLLTALGLGALYWVVTTLRMRRGRLSDHAAGGATMGWGNLALFLGPALLVYSVFVIVPSLQSFSWSVHGWDGISPRSSMPWAGLLNFRRMLFESDPFWTALNNNLFVMTVVPLFVVPLALFLAACISRGVFGAKWFRIIFFFPNLLGSVAATLLWMRLYDPQSGLVNITLSSIGFTQFAGFPWLAADNLYWAVIPISVWGACGFNMVLYLAAMENVSQDVYEAATIDGASPVRQFFSITIPLIWEAITISIVFLVIGGMKAFEIIWLLTNQRPTTDLHTVSTRMIQVMFQEYKVGEATAIAVLLFLMVFFGSALSLRVMRRDAVEM